MRSGWNPTRRNRNIGTKARGHGQNNKLVIPYHFNRYKNFYEDLTSYILVKRQIKDKEQLFIVEPTRSGWFYACTIDDMVQLLSYCTDDALNSFDFIILRQPTRKQCILSNVWGRTQFGVYLNSGLIGSAIILEAHNLKPYCWGKSLNPEAFRELERLKQDGHVIEQDKRGFMLSPTFKSYRQTVLFRTLLHEIGHHIDSSHYDDEEWNAKTKSQKEDFAHRYAQEQYDFLAQKSLVPFDSIVNEVSMIEERLNPSWFVPNI